MEVEGSTVVTVGTVTVLMLKTEYDAILNRFDQFSALKNINLNEQNMVSSFIMSSGVMSIVFVQNTKRGVTLNSYLCAP